MSPRGSISTVITTVLGVTLSGLLIWRVYRRERKRLPCSHKAVDSPVVEEAPPPVSVESPATPVSSPPPPPPPPPSTPALPSPEQLLRVAPVVVGSEDEWERAWPALRKDLAVFPVLGLDCEWVSVKGRTSMVSLLQMASYSGRCVLVRMLSLRGGGARSIPLSLMEVLRDPHVLKVGVGCYEDAKRLIRDHGLAVGCTVDLRYLVLRRKVLLNNGMSLKSLAADLLGVSLDKSLALRCSDWEAQKLTAEQVRYAACDAQVSVALFFHLLGLGGDSSPSPCSSIGPSPRSSSSPAYFSTSSAPYAQLAAHCQGLVDVPFREGRGSGRGAAEEDENTPFRGGVGGGGGGDRRPRRLAFESPEAGDQQVPDPRHNQKRKPLGVGYFARKSPLYDNCFLYAPDGEPLCTCDKKKAKWYLDKGLGVLESQDPFVVRLLFEPAGRPESKQDYYLTAKENLCVVCGKEDSYIRKNIVPHEYRRHFPAELKDHNSHDILLLCTACHAASNVHDGSLKQLLAEEHGAPQGCEEGVRVLEDSDRRRVRSAARALLTAGDALPQRRRSELQGLIQDFLEPDGRTDGGELTSEDLQYAAELETRIFNASYVPHGLKVVRAQAGGGGGLRGLMELERRWRQHFLSSMRPRHLPPLWAVDHNHRKLRHKYGEDLPVLPH